MTPRAPLSPISTLSSIHLRAPAMSWGTGRFRTWNINSTTGHSGDGATRLHSAHSDGAENSGAERAQSIQSTIPVMAGTGRPQATNHHLYSMSLVLCCNFFCSSATNVFVLVSSTFFQLPLLSNSVLVCPHSLDQVHSVPSPGPPHRAENISIPAHKRCPNPLHFT